VGFDRGRGAKRIFRLSRMTTALTLVAGSSFEPPAGFNAKAELAALNELPLQKAILDVDKDRLLALRKRAIATGQSADGGVRDRIQVDFRDPEQLAEELASYGPQVKVSEPADLRTAVVRRLKAAEDLQLRQQPIYMESITVFGHRSEPAKIPLEQRFANALNAPAAAGTMEIRPMDTTPCPSMASTWNTIGSSFAPLTGCPR